MKKIAVFILILFSLFIRAMAQEGPNKTLLADNLFDRYEYFKSLNIYLELAGKSHAKIHPVERVADCYRLMNDYENAEIWYQKAVSFPTATPIDIYYYAEVLLRNKKLTEAKEQYNLYYTKITDPEQLKFKLATCDSAQKWMKLPPNGFTVKNEHRFNSKFSDWGLNYFGKNDFVFISDRKVSDNKKDIYNRNGDGYIRPYKTEGDLISELSLQTANNPIFQELYHVGPVAFNAVADTAYITITTTISKSKISLDKNSKNTQRLYTRRLQLVIATKVNDKWTTFKSFPYNNVKEYSVGNATLSKNGNTLYFSSDMPGSEGKTDIWYTTKQLDGTWDKPINCGKLINTKEDDSFPTMSSENTLYYSSTGLPGMGGLDIYKAKGEKANWSNPENLKFPVNSTRDDFYYITLDNASGYFSSNREGGEGSDDIYSFSYDAKLNALLNAKLSSAKLSVIPAGIISGGKPANTATNTTSITIAKSGSTPAAIALMKNVPLTTVVPTLKKGTSFILNNIYYDVNKSDIRPDAGAQLDKLAVILKEHPSLIIEIASHTDSRAPSAYNMGLSNRRAASAVAYLVKLGIAPKRLVPKGYGDTQLLNNCAKGEYCTEEEHQINRRTEVHILQNNEL